MVPLTSKLRRFSRCSFLRMTKAAIPQKVYPPWASMPGTPPMPPSQFWHLRAGGGVRTSPTRRAVPCLPPVPHVRRLSPRYPLGRPGKERRSEDVGQRGHGGGTVGAPGGDGRSGPWHRLPRRGTQPFSPPAARGARPPDVHLAADVHEEGAVGLLQRVQVLQQLLPARASEL